LNLVARVFYAAKVRKHLD